VNWDERVAFVAAQMGWTWDETLDQMDCERFAALCEEWRRRPPVHWLLARFLGYGGEAEEPPQRMDADAARALMAATGGRIEGVAPLRG
jgi:hypothetical protein